MGVVCRFFFKKSLAMGVGQHPGAASSTNTFTIMDNMLIAKRMHRGASLHSG